MTPFSSWEDAAAVIEHTAIGPDVLPPAVVRLAKEVNIFEFHAAVVTPNHVRTAYETLGDDRSLVAVIGYPYGIEPTASKLAAIEEIDPYVDEYDLVMNRINFAAGDHGAIVAEIDRIVKAVSPKPLKVIIETPVLSSFDIGSASELVLEGGADFVKTAVGYDGPASVRHVELIKATVGDRAGVKASGGIRTYADVVEMVEAGADRIGTSSGVSIHTSAKRYFEIE